MKNITKTNGWRWLKEKKYGSQLFLRNSRVNIMSEYFKKRNNIRIRILSNTVT